jgi:hypothetical protein
MHVTARECPPERHESLLAVLEGENKLHVHADKEKLSDLFQCSKKTMNRSESFCFIINEHKENTFLISGEREVFDLD